jgi:cytochrome c-type biogenesis protein CcmE
MNVKKLVLGVTLAVVFAGLGIMSLAGSTVASASFHEARNRGERVEIYGLLEKTTIRPLRGANLVAFDLVEESSGERLTVLYDNPHSALPGNFPAASHARAGGIYDPTQQRFVADRVLTKCPSKYEEKNLDVATRQAVEQWQGATVSAPQGY